MGERGAEEMHQQVLRASDPVKLARSYGADLLNDKCGLKYLTECIKITELLNWGEFFRSKMDPGAWIRCAFAQSQIIQSLLPSTQTPIRPGRAAENNTNT